ncbi:MAG: hypothetical protein AAGJ46_16195 [Planctomycetota bacterium]
MFRAPTTVLAAMLLASVCAGPAFAYVDFQKVFVAKYVTDESSKDFTKLVKKTAKCYLCHQGKNKKNDNVYGEHLDELLDKGDRKDKEKVMAALDEVAKIHSVPGDEASPTYGDLIADEKLPVDLETAKKEPEDL